MIKHTVYPGVTDDYCALRKLQLGDFDLHGFILKASLLNGDDFITVAIGMEIGT